MPVFYQRPFFVSNRRPLKLYEKLGLTLLAIPVVLFVIIPGVLILSLLWIKNMRILRSRFEQANRASHRRRASGPIQPEVILPDQKQIHS